MKKRSRRNFSSLLFAAVVLAASLGMTCWAWHNAQHATTSDMESEFELRVRDVKDRIEHRMAAYEHVLHGTAGFIASSNTVSRQEFKTYIASLDLGKNYPGITGIGIARIVPKEQLAKHISEMRKQGFPSYTVFPRGNHLFYAPIIMRYPFSERSRAALGFDPYSEPLRRMAMDKARNSGAAAPTSKLIMVTETQPEGFLMYLPVYRNKSVPSSKKSRQADIVGWVYAAVSISELMKTLSEEASSDIGYEVYNGLSTAKDKLMFASLSDFQSRNPDLKTEKHIRIGAQTWTLIFRSLSAFEAKFDNGKSTFVAKTGITLSLLLTVLTYLLSTGRARALALANRMTIDLRRSEARYVRIIEGSDQGFWDWNLETGECNVSPRFESMLGYGTGEHDISANNWKKYTHPDDTSRAKQQLELHLQGYAPLFEVEIRCRTRDGQWKWVHTRGKVVSSTKDGRPLIISGSCTDISTRKKAEEELQLASLVYQNSSEAILVTDEDGTIVAINPAFTRLTGYAQEEVLGKRPGILKSGRHDREFYEAMWNTLTANGQWQGEIWNRKKNGEVYPEWLNINSTFKEDGSVHRRVALFSDITKKKALENLIWQQANFDTLTGLPNRRRFLERLKHEISKYDRHHLAMALIFLDLDYFKEINDTLGHAAGDFLLKIAAERLNGCVRRTDLVARLGGDEFTIILGELADLSSVERIANKILDKLSEPFALDGEVAYVSASIGITFYPNDAADSEGLLRNADQAMYAAKEQGRGRYSFYNASLQDAVLERRQMIRYLHDALDNEQFRVAYQPIIDLKTGAIRKAEALIRWRHPERGHISPEEFISIAEEIGLIHEIGNRIFHEAKEQSSKWRQCDPEFQVSVNVSPVQFRSEGTDSSTWLDRLQGIGLPRQGIVVEITEGLLLDANDSVKNQLFALRDAGIEVALDDFGTGYSSLSYLKKFDIDYIKIDQSFVRNLTAESDDLALCEAMIVMAHKLGLKVIAEGVETQEQRDLLVEAKCDYAQGYFFFHPIFADKLDELLFSTYSADCSCE